MTTLSSRSATRISGTFIRTTSGSRSLERGLEILRAFRPGVTLLTNADLALRTGLPRPTVSRLTRSLVEQGFLDYDIPSRSYQLSPVFLSFAYAYWQADSSFEQVYPVMRKLAVGEGVNVGLARPDYLEMVYVVALRESRRGVFRRAAAGSRFPIELTSGGRAYLAALGNNEREAVLNELKTGYGNDWADIEQQIDVAMHQIWEQGYCAAHWQPGMTGVGTALTRRDGRIYTLAISFHSPGNLSGAIEKFGTLLLELKGDIDAIWQE